MKRLQRSISTVTFFLLIVCGIRGLSYGLGETGAYTDDVDVQVRQRLGGPIVLARAPITVLRGAYRASSSSGVDLEDVAWAIYEIRDVMHGALRGTNVTVYYGPRTLRGQLPMDAILIGEMPIRGSDDRGDARVTALGNEAWRGIQPYTHERWTEIKQANIEDLADNRPESWIPLSEAIHLVEADRIGLAAPHLRSESHQWLSKYMRYAVSRVNFGWMIGEAGRTDERNWYRLFFIYRVSDDWHVTSRTPSRKQYGTGDDTYAPEPLTAEEFQSAYRFGYEEDVKNEDEQYEVNGVTH